MTEIVPLRRDEVAQLSRTLAFAFAEDPIARWLFPVSQGRLSSLERFFAVQIRHGYLARGTVVWTSDHLAGAMWVASWAPALSAYDRLWQLSLMALLRGNYPRARSLTKVLARAHPREPHLYLASVGTHVDRRRDGHGSRLLSAFVASCDREGVSGYLECSLEMNVHFYERVGFRVVRTVAAPGGGPTLWLMLRDPVVDRLDRHHG